MTGMGPTSSYSTSTGTPSSYGSALHNDHDKTRRASDWRSECAEATTVPPLVAPQRDPCRPLDVFLVFDTSGSIEDSFEQQRVPSPDLRRPWPLFTRL